MSKLNLNFSSKKENFDKINLSFKQLNTKLKDFVANIKESNKEFKPLTKNFNTTEEKFKILNKGIPEADESSKKLLSTFKNLGKAGIVAFSVFELTNFVNTFTKGMKDVAFSTFEFKQSLDGTNDALALMGAEGFSTDFLQKIDLFTKALQGNIGASREFSVIAVSAFDSFDTALTRVNTILNTTRDNLQLNGKQIQSIVNNELQNAVTSTQALAAQYEVLSGGFTSTAESQKVLTASLKLATSGQADAGEVTRLLVSSMRAYRVSAEQAAETAAILNGVVEQGITTVAELSQGFGQAAGVARQAGISIEELGASIAVLTTTGIRTPIALTSFQSLADTIIAKSPEAEKALAKLRDSSGNVIRFDSAEVQTKGFVNTLKDLNEAIDGNAATLSEIIPEAQAYRAALALMANDSRDLEKATTSLGEKTAEALDEVFGISLDNRTQSFTKIVNQFSESIIELGSRMAPFFEKGVEGIERISGLIDFFNDLPEPVKKVAIGFIGMQIAVAKTTDGIISLVSVLIKLGAAIVGLRVANEVFGSLLSGNTKRISAQVKAINDLYKSKSGLLNILRQLAFGDRAHIAIYNDKNVAIKRLTEYYKIQGTAISKNNIEIEASSITMNRAKEITKALRINTGELKEVITATGKSVIIADNVFGNFIKKPIALSVGLVKNEFITLGRAIRNTTVGIGSQIGPTKQLAKQLDATGKRLTVFSYTADRGGKVFGTAFKGITKAGTGALNILTGLFAANPIGIAGAVALGGAYLAFSSKAAKAYKVSNQIRKEFKALNEEIRNQERDLALTSNRWKIFYEELDKERNKARLEPEEGKGILGVFEPFGKWLKADAEGYEKANKKYEEIKAQLKEEGYDVNKRSTYNIPEVKKRFEDEIGKDIDVSPIGVGVKNLNPFAFSSLAAEDKALEEYEENADKFDKITDQVEETYERIASGSVLSPEAKAKQRAGLALTTDDLAKERKEVETELSIIDNSIDTLNKRKEQALKLQGSSRSKKRREELEKEIQELTLESKTLKELREEYSRLADRREEYFTGQAALDNNLFGTKEDLVTDEELNESIDKYNSKTNVALDNLESQGLDITSTFDNAVIKPDSISIIQKVLEDNNKTIDDYIVDGKVKAEKLREVNEDLLKAGIESADVIEAPQLNETEFENLVDIQRSGNTPIVNTLKETFNIEQEVLTSLSNKDLNEIRTEVNSQDNEKIKAVFDKFKVELGLEEDRKLKKQEIEELKKTFLENTKKGTEDKESVDETLADYTVAKQEYKDRKRRKNILKEEDVSGTRIQNLAKSQSRLTTEAFLDFRKRYNEFAEFAKLTEEERKAQLSPEKLKEYNDVFVNGQIEGQKRLLEAIDSLDNAQASGSITAKEYAEQLKELSQAADLTGKPILKAQDQIAILTKILEAESDAIERSINNLEKKKQVLENLAKVQFSDQVFNAENEKRRLDSISDLNETVSKAYRDNLSLLNSLSSNTLEKAEREIEINKLSIQNLKDQQAIERERIIINQKIQSIQLDTEEIEIRKQVRQAQNDVQLKKQALKVVEAKGAEDDIDDAKVLLELAEQQVKIGENNLYNLGLTRDLNKDINKETLTTLDIKNAADKDAADVALRLSEIEKITIEYDLQIDALNRQNQLIDIQSNSFRSIIEGYSKLTEEQLQLLDSTKQSREAELNSISTAYNISKSLSSLEYTKRKLSKEEAEFQLRTLKARQELELEIFDIQEQQKETSRQRLEIENQIAQAKLQSEIKVKELELEQLQNTNASKEEIEAKQLDIDSSKEQLIGKEFEGQLIKSQNELERKLTAKERDTIEDRQIIDDFEARRDIVTSTLSKSDDIKLRKETLDYARKQSNRFERGLLNEQEPRIAIPTYEEFSNRRRKELGRTFGEIDTEYSTNVKGKLNSIREGVTATNNNSTLERPKIELVIPDNNMYERVAETATLIKNYYETKEKEITSGKSKNSKDVQPLDIKISVDANFNNAPSSITGADVTKTLEPQIRQSFKDILLELQRNAN